MDYFNNFENTDFYSTSYTPSDFDAYPFLDRASTTEESHGTFADGWDMGVQPDHEVGLSRSLEAEASFDTVTSTIPYDTQTDSDPSLSFPEYCCLNVQPNHEIGFPRSLEPEASFEALTSTTPYDTQTQSDRALSFPEYYWPVTDQHPQSGGSGVVSWENSFTSTAASKASTMVPVPSSSEYYLWNLNESSSHQSQTAPLDYWWNNESGSSANTFHDTNLQAPHQYSNGSTWTATARTPRFQPYGTPSARLNEHTNAEAGPSTLMPPLVSYMAPPTTHPSGGSSEPTADAEKNQTITEEEETPTTSRAQSTKQTCNWRTKYQAIVRRLRAWAKERGGLSRPPTHESALVTALGVLERTRAPVYALPRLKKGTAARSTQGKRASDAEDRRRKEIRRLNEELSRYYQLGVNQSVWGCPDLLLRVLDDLENRL